MPSMQELLKLSSEAHKAAEKEAERKAAVDPPEGAAVTKTLSDFLDALNP